LTRRAGLKLTRNTLLHSVLRGWG